MVLIPAGLFLRIRILAPVAKEQGKLIAPIATAKATLQNIDDWLSSPSVLWRGLLN